MKPVGSDVALALGGSTSSPPGVVAPPSPPAVSLPQDRVMALLREVGEGKGG